MTPTWIFITAAYGLTMGVVTILALTTYVIMHGTEHQENQWSRLRQGKKPDGDA